MAVQLLTLRRDDRCARCDVPIPASTKAWWDPSARSVTCVTCLPAEGTGPAQRPDTASILWPPPTPVDRGIAGTSADREAQAIQARSERRRRDDDPQRTDDWAARRADNFAKGADGERHVGAILDSLTEMGAVVLHDRKVPNTRGNIDHVVIAASGVWIVDAKNWEGRVERRFVGQPAQRVLYVNGRNRMDAVENLGWQIQAVRAALTPIGFAEAPVTGVLCFTGATWGLLAKPIRFRNALVTWPDNLVTEVADGTATDPAVIDLVAQQLSSKLPAIH